MFLWPKPMPRYGVTVGKSASKARVSLAATGYTTPLKVIVLPMLRATPWTLRSPTSAPAVTRRLPATNPSTYTPTLEALNLAS